MANDCHEQQLFICVVVIAHLASGPALHHKNANQSGGSVSRETSSDDGKNEQEKPPAVKRRRAEFHSSTDDENETAVAKGTWQAEERPVSLVKRSPRLAMKHSDLTKTVVDSLHTNGHR